MLKRINDVKEASDNLETNLSARLDKLQGDLIKTIQGQDNTEFTAGADTNKTDEDWKPSKDIQCMLGEFRSLISTIPIQHRILRQLMFPGMRSPRNPLPTDELVPCAWLLEGEDVQHISYIDGDQNRKGASRAFVTWLREGQNVFHISGKAGSGKSTLMRFLARNKRTKEELQLWAGEKVLVLAEFYFWSSPGADKLQMTLPGLYKALLFEVLRNCTEMMEDIFPRQWKRLNANMGDKIVESSEFEQEDIEEAFEKLLQKTKHGSHRFCFFIDGLDEYFGNTVAWGKLAQKLKDWTMGGDIKICASSRPYEEFKEVFSHQEDRTIHLHTINRGDIYVFCLDAFERDRAEVASYLYLVGKIADLAQGVFLWAYLVVDIILAAIHQEDKPKIIERKLIEEIPPELDDLYAKMRELVGKIEIDRVRSDKMLLLTAKNPFTQPLNALAFSWLDDEEDLANPNFPFFKEDFDGAYSEAIVQKRQKYVRKQIDGLTKGLLEVFEEEPNWMTPVLSFFRLRVRVFHRTARDYLLQSERVTSLQDSFPDFEQSDPYGRLRLAEYIFGLNYITKDSKGNLGEMLKSLYEAGSRQSLNAIRRFQAITQRLNETQPEFVFPAGFRYGMLNFRTTRYVMSEPGSFVHYAAYLGLKDFVLQELASDPQLKHASGEKSILYSAIAGDSWDLAGALLDNGIDLNYEMLVGPAREGERNSWPVWILATALTTMSAIAEEGGASECYQGATSLLRRLVKYGIDMGETFSMTLMRGNGSEPGYDFVGPVFMMSDFLQLGNAATDYSWGSPRFHGDMSDWSVEAFLRHVSEDRDTAPNWVNLRLRIGDIRWKSSWLDTTNTYFMAY